MPVSKKRKPKPKSRPAPASVSGRSQHEGLDREIVLGAPVDLVKRIKIYRRYVRALGKVGVTFRDIDRPDILTVTAMVREHITGVPDFDMSEEEGWAVAIGPDGEVIGSVVIGGATFQRGKVAFLRNIVVLPEWRGRGVATVLLNLIPAIFPADLIVGNCAASAAPLYANSGFTVLQPGVPLPFDVGARPHSIGFDNDVYPCGIYREL